MSYIFPCTNRSRRLAMTLIETLVVIAILGTLTALTLSGVQRVRGASARAQCANNLRQLGLAAQQHHTDRGRLPRGSFTFYEQVSWRGPLLPYLDQGSLWQTTKDQLASGMHFGDEQFLANRTVIRVFVCPADADTQSPQIRAGLSFIESNYFGNSGVSRYRESLANISPKGVLFEKSRISFADIQDGTSNTLLAGERPSVNGSSSEWYLHSSFGSAFLGVEEDIKGDDVDRKLCEAPIVNARGVRTNPCDELHFWSFHDGGANFLFCDGSVKFIAYSSRAILPALATRAGGDVATLLD